jgi:hypothetical protein
MKIKIYRTLTLPVILYGCKTWYLMLKDVLAEGVGEEGIEEDK